MATQTEIARRFRNLLYFALPFSLVMLILSFVPISNSEPWVWVKVVFQSVWIIIFIIWGTRLVLWQRDEYWRERGKDPKHPEPPSSRMANDRGLVAAERPRKLLTGVGSSPTGNPDPGGPPSSIPPSSRSRTITGA